MSAANRLAIIAALPREIALLVRRLDPHIRPEPALLRRAISLYRFPQVLVVAAGMGGRRAALAVEAALAAQDGSTTLLSTGLAGGCEPILTAGDVIAPGSVVDVNTGERFQATSGTTTMASADSIAGVAEKGRLFASYGAEAVDMEAATVGRLARAHGLPFEMLKGISDGFDFEMEGLNRFADAQGQFRTAAFAVHTALRPQTWAHAIALGKGSQRALQALTDALFVRARQIG